MSKRKVNSAEQIIMKLREAEVLLAQKKTIKETCRVLGISEQTYYRWRKEYGGLNTTQAKKLKELEKENARLKNCGLCPACWTNLVSGTNNGGKSDVPSGHRGHLGYLPGGCCAQDQSLHSQRLAEI